MARYNNIAFNGTLVLALGASAGFNKIFIMGGPFDTGINTADTWNLNLKAEGTRERFDAVLPIEDFSVPRDEMEVRVALEDAIYQALSGKIIVVGCMGGMGRTGLFLALLAKAAGYEEPVQFVREFYFKHAVETDDQKLYVKEFDVSWAPAFIRQTYLEVNDVRPVTVIHEAPAQIKNPGFFGKLANWWNLNFAR
ncbi:tyrosine phosphatase domain-containing protein [Rhizobium phage RHph_TM16]|nr:tyrosine phosphatase domain-containing protein [Rhizobium phage RHph_TM16]